VIVAWNATTTVRDAIASVLRQSRGDLEVIVVDDGSTDDTAANVASIPDARVRLLMRAHCGRAVARNVGIASASGRYVAFLDSDDMWLPRYLELAADRLETSQALGFAYTDAYRFDPAAARLSLDTVMEHHGAPATLSDDPREFGAALSRCNFIWGATVLPRHVLVEIGGFDETLAQREEWDLWLRILREGYRAARVPGIHGVVRSRQPPPPPIVRATRLVRGALRPGLEEGPPTPGEVAELLDDLGIATVRGNADGAPARPPLLWSAQTWAHWRRDRARYPRGAWLTHHSLWAVATFRLGEAVNACPTPMRLLLTPIYYTLTLLARIATGIEIGAGATIGPGLRIVHAGSIIVNPRARIGSDCTLSAGVIIGNRDSAAAPVIGDRVMVSAGSYVLGAVKIGDNAVVGAMSLVLADVPAGAIVAGVPARIIRMRPGLAG
jgi:serine O-acetyltransferase